MEKRLALIGFGEAGSTFAAAAGWTGGAGVWDVLPARRAAAAGMGLLAAGNAAEALANAPLVLSLVTADQALAAARAYAPLLAPHVIWCDMNSVAPGTKRAAAEVIAAAGAHYVDVAVLAPVHPARAEVLLRGAGFGKVRVVGTELGRASAIKMIRSVMVKGLEALTAEMVLGATKAGVLDEVLASLDASDKPMPWAVRANYNLDRMLVHGKRRAAEMAESSQTLQALGISPMMTDNTVQWQQALGDLAMAPPPERLEDKLAAIARAMASIAAGEIGA